MTALQICKAALEEIGAVQYCDACSLNRSCRSGCPGDKARAALEAAAKVGDDDCDRCDGIGFCCECPRCDGTGKRKGT